MNIHSMVVRRNFLVKTLSLIFLHLPLSTTFVDKRYMTEGKQRAQLAEYSEIVVDREGESLWNEYQQHYITELLFQIFTSRGKFPLNKIKIILDKIESGKQSEEQSAA
jgi:hypothetical protein